MDLIGPSSRTNPADVPNPPKVMNFIPAAFYFRLRLNGHTSWPVFRSTALPTFPRVIGSDTGSKQ
jgi:hypothetical protein